MSHVPTLGLRMTLAADAGLLPVPPPAPETELHRALDCSAAGWQLGLDGRDLWLRREESADLKPTYWRIGGDGATSAGFIHSDEPSAARVEAALSAPLGPASWLVSADAVVEAWWSGGDAALPQRVIVDLPADQGRPALALLESVWCSRGVAALDERVAAAVAASRGQKPQVVITTRADGEVQIALRLRQLDGRTERIICGQPDAADLARDRLLSLLASRTSLALDIRPGPSHVEIAFWTSLAG